ncbi:MAG: tetratricopeptide repeat protein, partial [Methylococcaceae bacterium]
KAAIERLQVKHPEDLVAENLAGMLFLETGEMERAKAAFESVLEKNPGNLFASNSLAKQLIKEKQLTKAKAVYENVLRIHPKHLPTELKLANIDAAESNLPSMKERLEVAIKHHPEALPPRLMLGRYFLQVGQPGRTQTLLGTVRKRFSKTPSFLFLLAEAQLADNQSARAKETAEQLVRIDPDSAENHFMLSKIYGANGDARKMRTSLNEALRVDPKLFKARLVRVKMLAQDKKISQAKIRLAEITDDYPENPSVWELQGWLALRENEPKRAADVYQKMLDKYPSTDLAINLAKVQWTLGEKDKAIATLANWSEQHPDDSKVDYYRSVLYAALGQTGKAQKTLEKVISTNPKNVLALNDLAWNLRKKDTNKALEYIEKAMESTPKAIAILDTYAMILAEKRQFERAETMMMQVISRTSKKSIFKYHLALIQKKSGQIEKARNTLSEIFSSGEDFSEKAEAELLYKKLSGRGS